MNQEEYPGLSDFAAQVLASDECDAVRVRVGKNGRSTTVVPGKGQVDPTDYNQPSELARALRVVLQQAQHGGGRPAWLLEAMDEDGKAIKGLRCSGKKVPFSMPKVDAKGGGELAMLSNIVGPLVEAVVRSNESLRLTNESQAQTIAEMGRERWDRADRFAYLREELATTKLRAELGAGGGLGAEEEAGFELMKEFVGAVRGGGAGLTKDALIKAIEKNPKQAIKLMSDPDVHAKIEQVMKADAKPNASG